MLAVRLELVRTLVVLNMSHQIRALNRSSLTKFYMINFHDVSKLRLFVDLNLGQGDVLLGKTCRFLPSHAFATLVVDLKELVDFLK